MKKKQWLWVIVLALVWFLSACNIEGDSGQVNQALETEGILDLEGYYTSKDDVAMYLNLYETLPLNYISKEEAKALGWQASEGNLWQVADQMLIGGDAFGNWEGLLPKKEGRYYYECDLDYKGGYRNAKRLVYSNDGLIFYTDDHYESFTLMFGDDS